MCLSDLVGAWLELEEPQELGELKEPQELQEPWVLVKPFVLKLAYPVDFEVDGSEGRTAVRISERQVQQESPFSPFWHSLLLLIPC